MASLSNERSKKERSTSICLTIVKYVSILMAHMRSCALICIRRCWRANWIRVCRYLTGGIKKWVSTVEPGRKSTLKVTCCGRLHKWVVSLPTGTYFQSSDRFAIATDQPLAMAKSTLLKKVITLSSSLC